jgi:iron complex outermembrane receptor protein
MSIDYWSVDIKDSIGLPTTQDIIDNCAQGFSDFCEAIDFVPGSKVISIVRRTPFNYTKQVARGVDYEASYRFDASSLYSALPGAVQVRALATNYKRNATTTRNATTGLDVVDDTAGMNTSFGPPDWKFTASVDYAYDAVHASLTARGVSAGVYDNDWIECSSNCPTSTTKYQTVSDNHIDGAVFLDASFSYKIDLASATLESFVNVRNLTDKDPPVVASPAGGFSYTLAPANARLYDVLGRTFTVGFRMGF